MNRTRFRTTRHQSTAVVLAACAALATVTSAVLWPVSAHAQTAGGKQTASLAVTNLPSRRDAVLDDGGERGTNSRTLMAGNSVVYPFGAAQPVVSCTLLRVCVVELQAGEVVVNEPITGDPIRWIIESAKAGPDGRNALIVVKPKFCQITTNLIIPTDRRIYDLTLDSPPCRGGRGDQYNPQQPYARHVRFTYPDDSSATRPRTAPGAPNGAPSTGTISTVARRDSVNRSYRIVRTRRGPFGIFGHHPVDFPWEPAAVYDDGAHLYVQLPAEARHDEAPVLYALQADGSQTLLNYTVAQTPTGDGLYVADRVVPRLVLLLRDGSRERRLVIENRGVRSASEDTDLPEEGR